MDMCEVYGGSDSRIVLCIPYSIVLLSAGRIMSLNVTVTLFSN